MSRENVEIVRRIYEATARRDGAAIAATYQPDVVWSDAGSPLGELQSGATNRGFDGLMAWFRAWHAEWEDLTYTVEELVDAGDRVLAIVTMRGRGRTSGAEVEKAQYAVWRPRDGKVVEALWFRTLEEAQAAAGTG